MKSKSSEIYDIRVALNETQEQFAERFGITRQTLNGWENGKLPHGRPTLEYLSRELAKLRRRLNRRRS